MPLLGREMKVTATLPDGKVPFHGAMAELGFQTGQTVTVQASRALPHGSRGRSGSAF